MRSGNREVVHASRTLAPSPRHRRDGPHGAEMALSPVPEHEDMKVASLRIAAIVRKEYSIDTEKLSKI